MTTLATAPAATVPAWSDDAQLISLSRRPCSPAAQALTNAIADELEPRLVRVRPLGPAGRASHRADVGAIIGGLLKAGLRGGVVRAEQGKAGRQWRSSGAAKQALGYDRFWSKAKAMIAAGLIEQRSGIRYASGGSFTGEASQLRCEPALLDRAVAAGITAETFAADWPITAAAQEARPVLWGDPVRCLQIPAQGRKAVSEGAFPIDQEGRVGAINDHLGRLNDHLAGAAITGCVPPALVRKFFSDTRLGGRFYAVGSDPYQTMRSADRGRLLRINGERTVEVDLRASVLSILLAVAGQPIPADPYAAGGLAAFDREAVKAFFTQALNGGRLPTKWSPGFPEAVRTASIRRIRDAAVQTYPALTDAPALLPADLAAKLQTARGGLGWGLGQWLAAIEAEVIERALDRLMAAGAIALPLHDALIVRERDAQEAHRSLVEAFKEQVGATPRVKVKGACSES